MESEEVPPKLGEQVFKEHWGPGKGSWKPPGLFGTKASFSPEKRLCLGLQLPKRGHLG